MNEQLSIPEENPNKNCLVGMQCPNCGSFGWFDVVGLTTATLSDDGVEDHCDLEFEEYSPCTCKECGHQATVAEFRGGKEEKCFILIQEGGTSLERYIHAWDSQEDAEQDRIDCSRDGAYRTSPVLEIPVSLAAHPDFYEVVESILSLTHEMTCVEYEEDEPEDEE